MTIEAKFLEEEFVLDIKEWTELSMLYKEPFYIGTSKLTKTTKRVDPACYEVHSWEREDDQLRICYKRKEHVEVQK
jgi:hypothetical protein